MSVIARGTKSIRKQDVAEQKTIALSFKKIVFAHQANAGETGINITSLVAPPDMTAKGFVNPSVSSLSKVNIYQNKNNLKVVSSLSGILIPYLSYTVNSSVYIAFNGFTAAQDEVFTCYLDEVPTTSLSVVDGAPIIASGTLLAGQTDFNIGTPIEINKYSTQQIGAVMVYVDRGLQYRKVGNVTGGDGDYIEVPVAGGLGSLIRFDASASDRFVTVVSNGVVAERPDGSMTALIENVQGQIDQIVPTVAALAGVPETNFQISPNSVDLKQFGDKVIEQETIINLMKTVSIPFVGQWTSFVPSVTNFGPAGTLVKTAAYRRIGDSAEVSISFRQTDFSTSTGSISFDILPSPLTIDTSKLNTMSEEQNSGGGFRILGYAVSNGTANDDQYIAEVMLTGTSTTTAGIHGPIGQGFWSTSGGVPFAWSGASRNVIIKYTVPIAGWSSTQTIAEILGI
jgi:hypothetical protein